MKELLRIDGCAILGDYDGRIEFTADADIDADGSPRAYHRDGRGLDHLSNAGRPGNWFGIVTKNGQPWGEPVIQNGFDPEPGYYVSATSYQHTEFERNNPRRYVDSERVPFIVVPRLVARAVRGIVLGCAARVTHEETNKSVDCVVADFGPSRRLGELSIAAAVAIGIPSSPRTGGEERRIIRYEIWPGVAALVHGFTYKLQALHV